MNKLKKICIIILLLLLNSCLVVHNLQRSKLLPPDEKKISVSYNNISYVEDDIVSSVGSHNYGLQLTRGVSENMNFYFNYQYLSLRGDDNLTHRSYFELGPKFKLKSDNHALYLGIACYFDKGRDFVDDLSNHLEFRPTYFYSKRIIQNNELNLGFGAILNQDDLYISGACGITFKINDKFSILPSVGILFNPSATGTYTSFGIKLLL